jgi:hypothetical protein
MLGCHGTVERKKDNLLIKRSQKCVLGDAHFSVEKPVQFRAKTNTNILDLKKSHNALMFLRGDRDFFGLQMVQFRLHGQDLVRREDILTVRRQKAFKLEIDIPEATDP